MPQDARTAVSWDLPDAEKSQDVVNAVRMEIPAGSDQKQLRTTSGKDQNSVDKFQE
jgi:hypothetical protein